MPASGAMAKPPVSPELVEKQLGVTRAFRRAALFCLLAPIVFTVNIVVLNKLTSGGLAFFVSGAPWTHRFWSSLFGLMVLGVLLSFLTVGRRCPRCGNPLFMTRTYSTTTTVGRPSRVNVFAQRCVNCHAPLKGT
jgi:hypothetical protein